jgi:hypothetical protein
VTNERYRKAVTGAVGNIVDEKPVLHSKETKMMLQEKL